MIHALKEITAMQELIEHLKRELDSERTRNQQLVTECNRLRAIAGAQDSYAYDDGCVRLDTREDVHKVIGDGD